MRCRCKQGRRGVTAIVQSASHVQREHGAYPATPDGMRATPLNIARLRRPRQVVRRVRYNFYASRTTIITTGTGASRARARSSHGHIRVMIRSQSRSSKQAAVCARRPYCPRYERLGACPAPISTHARTDVSAPAPMSRTATVVVRDERPLWAARIPPRAAGRGSVGTRVLERARTRTRRNACEPA